MFSVSLVSRSPKDTRVCETRVRLTTPYEGRGNMRKVHKDRVLNPAERTCQREQHVVLCDVHLCADSLYRLSCRHTVVTRNVHQSDCVLGALKKKCGKTAGSFIVLVIYLKLLLVFQCTRIHDTLCLNL